MSAIAVKRIAIGTGRRYKKGMDLFVALLLLLPLTAIGVLMIGVTRRLRTKRNGRRRWYETRHAFHAFDVVEAPGNATWVTSCNDGYFEGVLKLHRSMRRVGSEHPLLCFCTDSTTAEQERTLIEAGITTKRVRLSSLTNPYKEKWLEAFVKLECWRLEEYDKVCWIDSDTIQLQNADELLGVPLKPHGIACAVDHEVFPEESEHVRLRMIQTGVFVLRPSMETYEMITSRLGTVASVDGSDQGFLTSYFALSSFDDVCFLSSEYNYMKRGLTRHPEFDLSRIRILHFVGKPKPWDGGEPGHEELQRIWDQI
ncbi:MAG: hypothetical protein GY728_12690 [Phycisphaeraceae bacterium]|nr:hypothetical protein [Phycisphaeraceae bacterium]